MINNIFPNLGGWKFDNKYFPEKGAVFIFT